MPIYIGMTAQGMPAAEPEQVCTHDCHETLPEGKHYSECKAAEPEQERAAGPGWPECKDFYDLMQAYRHWPLVDQKGTIERYEAVKSWLRDERKPALDIEAAAREIAKRFMRDVDYPQDLLQDVILGWEPEVEAILRKHICEAGEKA
jgi:hypothetical protein